MGDTEELPTGGADAGAPHARPETEAGDEPPAKKGCVARQLRVAAARCLTALAVCRRTAAGRDIFLRGGPKKELAPGQVRVRTPTACQG